MRDQKVQLANEFLNALASGDFSKLSFADDFSAWTGLSGDIPGNIYRERAGQICKLFLDAFTPKVVALTIEDGRIALQAVSDGTLITGAKYHNDYHFLIELNHAGEIHKLWEYMNVKTAAELIVPAFAEYARRSGQI